MRAKVYVGIRPNLNREVFQSAAPPTEETHGGRYVSVTGPFRTVRGARFMSDCENSPHILTVGDAERAAKAFADADRGELRRAMAYVKTTTRLNQGGR